MRYSQQRELIKKIVRGTNCHPSADWIFNQTKKIIPNISLGTVYRNLKRLEQEGEINAIYYENIVRYDWNVESHDHLKCTECGDLIDVRFSHDEFKSIVKRKYKFDANNVEVMIIGTCKKHAKYRINNGK